MSGKSSQRKGRAGERELSQILQNYGYNTAPGLPLNYGKDPDVIGLPGVHVECKRSEKVHLSNWMQQAIADADRFQDGKPVVFHRRSREPWLCTMRLQDFMIFYQAWDKAGFPLPGADDITPIFAVEARLTDDKMRIVRDVLRAPLTEEERREARIPIPEGATRYEALLSVLRQAGLDVSIYPERLPDD